MNIKSLVKSQRIRHAILKCFCWVPDCIMLPFQYRLILKHWPNMKNPKRYTEWIQTYKSCYRNPNMLQCVDKYAVRQYVANIIGKGFLNYLYQVCDTADEINFDVLPNKFVIKTTDGGNGDNVLLIKDKSTINISEIISTVNSWREKKYYAISREWAYKGAKQSRIIVEKLLESPENADGSIDDYKFLCFNGKAKILWIDKNRFSNHLRGFWDENLTFLRGVYSDHSTFEKEPKLPENIKEMKLLAEQLAKGFPHVRVDLYNIDNKIIFGEMTFYPWSGYVKFTPDTFDYLLGSYFSDWRDK